MNFSTRTSFSWQNILPAAFHNHCYIIYCLFFHRYFLYLATSYGSASIRDRQYFARRANISLWPLKEDYHVTRKCSNLILYITRNIGEYIIHSRKCNLNIICICFSFHRLSNIFRKKLSYLDAC